MKLVNSFGGHSIGVYDANTNDKTKVRKMMRAGSVKYYVPADYSDGTEMDRLVKAIIDRTAANEALEEIYVGCKRETEEADKENDEATRRRKELINELDCSGSFKQTHEIIGELSKYGGWTDEEIEFLCETAMRNSQVYFILNDYIIKTFYLSILKEAKELGMNAKEVKKMLGIG